MGNPEPSATSPSIATSGTKASYKISSAFSDAIALVRSPVSFMNANSNNDPALQTLMTNYVAVLAAVPFVALLIGDAIFARGLGFGRIFGGGILYYILDIASVYIVGNLMWRLGPGFGTNTTQIRATRVAAYVFTPVFLISILTIIPFIGFLSFVGALYGLYIMYLGMPILLNTPKDKVVVYLIVTLVVTFVVLAIVYVIVGLVTLL
jgi:hypothetical protein